MTDRLLSGQALRQGSKLTSPSGQFFIQLQSDGNLVLYRVPASAVWASDTNAIVNFAMQTDGNLVGYNSANTPVWATNTNGNPGARFVLQDDGNLVVYSTSDAPLWASNTKGGVKEKSGGFFSKVAGTLGGAAAGLAHGVAAAAQVSGKAFTEVTTSKAWQLVAMGVGTVGNLALPGIATGISAAMLTASKIGAAAGSKDGVIAAARDLIPGDAGKTGFDIGTGIAIHGEGMTSVALQAARDKIPAGSARAGFDSALALHVGRATAKTPAPAHLPPQARVAYYVGKGLIKAGAPRNMRKAVAATVITTPAAKLGLETALTKQAPVEQSYLEWLWGHVHATLTGTPVKTHPIAIRGEYPS